VRELHNPELDKPSWGAGPWIGEPDKRQWIDPASNLDCLMVRNRAGAWCGYVGVSEGHPAFGRGYDDVPTEVHGGLTFASFCAEEGEEFGICHLPEHGRPERIWWLGFDCNHGGDTAPATDARYRDQDQMLWHSRGAVYRDMAYAETEVTALAWQLRDIGKRGYLK
jgi:hypothetical protein